MLAIQTKELRKSYGPHEVVRGISLRVNQGEIFGFLGRNGAGKTTFINMLTGIVRPSGGDFSILGTPHGQLDRVKRHIGVLPDYTEFYGNDTALEHLRYFSGVKGLKVSKRECLDVLDKVGLSQAAYVKTKKFSFGMKKKLGVAQAILGQPGLIFLDEPTSGMDPESALEMQQLIRTLADKRQTIFMTSHNLHEVEKLCTRIAIMKRGNITGLGTIEELQRTFQPGMQVTVKLAARSDELYGKAREALQQQGVCRIQSWDERHLTAEIGDEADIAAVIRVLCSHEVDMFSVQTARLSLEDIFMLD
ncbi:ABC transporter ATP-binding protein [Paenibacillus elgii]|uniref:ABC transporter ATP-binding protein n=1 Tax=Paenibacillus elgii TaxID=189691 RepID=UPI000FD7AEDF|nr:ABC transporter ATP-binding protein [Paenibacillus elgii]NEN87275.1 ABC transporter ATP-binding protein [Paenibacillus elgii]